MNSDHGTVIGPRTRISGHLQGDEDLTVLGRVDGNISGDHTLVVEATGVVVAETIVVGRALISGTVVGNISATELVHIAEGGRVVGDLHAPRIILAEGALFRGNVDMGPLDDAAFAKPRAARQRVEERPAVVEDGASESARPAPRPARPPRKIERAPAPAPALRKAPAAVVRKAPEPAPAPAPTPVAPRSSRAAGSLESKANAAALAVARAVKKDSARAAKPAAAKSSKKAPKPPTTAGRKTRAKRK